MIPATRPHVARYEQQVADAAGKPHTYYTEKPVIAWDDAGHPLVADKRQLERADRWSNFHDVVGADSPVVAVIPGGGWMSEFKDDETGTLWSDPVVAWLFLADGSCKPVDASADGWCDDPTEDSNFVRLHHPDSIGLPDSSASGDAQPVA